MTKYNTGNPLGSSDPRDLYDNAENLDAAVNSDGATFTDRLGKSRLTVQGMVDAATTGNPAVGAAQDALASADRAEAQADRAESQADRAELEVVEGINTGVSQVTNLAIAEADRAEIARDAAFVNADVYDSIAAGLSATVDGEQFQVVEGNEIVRYRRDSSTTQTEVARYPSIDRIEKSRYTALEANETPNLISREEIQFLKSPEVPTGAVTVTPVKVDGMPAASVVSESANARVFWRVPANKFHTGLISARVEIVSA